MQHIKTDFPYAIREIENTWIPLADGTRLEVLANPFGLQGLPQRLDPPPSVGQHNAQILAELQKEP